MMPEELPDYNRLKTCRVVDYTPEWRKRAAEPPKPVENQRPTPPSPDPVAIASENSDWDDEPGMVEITKDSVYDD